MMVISRSQTSSTTSEDSLETPTFHAVVSPHIVRVFVTPPVPVTLPPTHQPNEVEEISPRKTDYEYVNCAIVLTILFIIWTTMFFGFVFGVVSPVERFRRSVVSAICTTNNFTDTIYECCEARDCIQCPRGYSSPSSDTTYSSSSSSSRICSPSSSSTYSSPSSSSSITIEEMCSAMVSDHTEGKCYGCEDCCGYITINKVLTCIDYQKELCRVMCGNCSTLSAIVTVNDATSQDGTLAVIRLSEDCSLGETECASTFKNDWASCSGSQPCQCYYSPSTFPHRHPHISEKYHMFTVSRTPYETPHGYSAIFVFTCIFFTFSVNTILALVLLGIKYQRHRHSRIHSVERG